MGGTIMVLESDRAAEEGLAARAAARRADSQAPGNVRRGLSGPGGVGPGTACCGRIQELVKRVRLSDSRFAQKGGDKGPAR
jgi:xanthine/CO dehydrogenase XdhC/CoxF family maturation factor